MVGHILSVDRRLSELCIAHPDTAYRSLTVETFALLTPWLTDARARSAEGSDMGHEMPKAWPMLAAALTPS